MQLFNGRTTCVRHALEGADCRPVVEVGALGVSESQRMTWLHALSPRTFVAELKLGDPQTKMALATPVGRWNAGETENCNEKDYCKRAQRRLFRIIMLIVYFVVLGKRCNAIRLTWRQ